MSPQPSAADTAVTVCKPAPCAGTIKAVRVVQKTLGAAASASFTLDKSGVNILSATSINNQADLVAATPKDATLTTNTAALKVATTDYLDAVYTLTTCALTSAIGVWIAIEPDLW